MVFGLATLGVWIFNHQHHPENAIVGTWEEVNWQYAKVNGKSNQGIQKISPEERYEIANHLVVHAFETWSFGDNEVVLHKKNGQKHRAKWMLSGRGHILKMTNPDQTTEVYQIEQLSKNILVLHFETNVHARGIVKITLKRTNNA